MGLEHQPGMGMEQQHQRRCWYEIQGQMHIGISNDMAILVEINLINVFFFSCDNSSRSTIFTLFVRPSVTFFDFLTYIMLRV